MRYSQQGLTLIELMVSLVLGLIIVAAAVMLFITGQKSFALQQGAADIQDNANFALNYIVKDIRMANLNNSSAIMTKNLSHAGIVVATGNITGATSSTPISASTVSQTSNVNVGSDQLVIQYLPTQSQVDNGLFDCEGTQVKDASVYVIERYFVRQDDNINSNETAATALALACDAGRATSTGVISSSPSIFGDRGQIIMKRVDYFHVLLTVQNSSGDFQGMTIAQYTTNAPTARIVGVKLGILARSNQSVGVDPNINLTKPFTVLDQSVTLNSTIQNAQTKNLRQVITQAVAIRNALGDR
ncbi:prepilin-type N-terminal cleavage/methylation domain-containing protein [Acinetobacter sp. ANC 4633]|uniref:PilW family protein n=1 Tax=Acinetobacter sp. ANC 4633 TaxID=2529845 RepID=UPI00103FC365|nr:PilW family protein [Acinetobacter sp. ANC 4633]TCB25218.1 prepilin-type N-terminal cleavage/methylation domain-containing protein [Acinetobacter sp. ANC 4633]